ncbi:MAG: hypothetical protein ACKVQV_11895 [Bacteroidia bacterium]
MKRYHNMTNQVKKHFIIFLIIACPIFLQAQHLIITKTGERLNGELQKIEDNTVTFFHKGSLVTFQLGQIKSIEFEGAVGGGSSISQSGEKGIFFLMPGRKITKQPKVDNLTMEKGIVVVAITINKYGDVVKADPGVEGTTTTSQYLLTKGKQAAESAKFDGGTTMPLEQKGTITITF